MGELRLEPWKKERSYGVFARGRVDNVPVRVRSPHEDIDDATLEKIVLHNGLTTGHESMAAAARTAARMGYAAVTYDYTNLSPRDPLSYFDPHSWVDPLSKNADDGMRVTESLPDGAITQHGLSEGGAVATLVARRTDRDTKWLNLISPGAFIHGIDKLSTAEITKAFCQEAVEEVLASIPNCSVALRVALNSLRTCIERPFSMPVELRQLLHDTAYDDLRAFRLAHTGARVLLAHTSEDRLVPEDMLLASLSVEEAAGKLIDIDFRYQGTHGRSTSDESITRGVLTLESNAPVKDAA